MKDISQLSVDLSKLIDKLPKQIKEANELTAEAIWEDVVGNAPVKTGNYISSIKVQPTKVSSKEVSTEISTDLVVATKAGNGYNLGFLLETGTDPHAIPNAFGWGDIYGYDSPQYERTLSPDWHPGTVAQPHWHPALEKNEITYLQNIKRALEEAEK